MDANDYGRLAELRRFLEEAAVEAEAAAAFESALSESAARLTEVLEGVVRCGGGEVFAVMASDARTYAGKKHNLFDVYRDAIRSVLSGNPDDIDAAWAAIRKRYGNIADAVQ